MREGELQTIRKLERIDISKPILNMRVDDQLGKSQYFSNQMECVSESRLLSLLCGKSLDRFQIHIVVKMKIIEVFPVNKQVEHIETLATDL